jgi:hypothetical protein
VPDAPNYLDRLAGEIGLLAPGCPVPLLRIYAVLALAKGCEVTLEDVHNSWVAWQAETLPDHPSLVPFGDLSPVKQAMDAPYRDAIAAVAGRLAFKGSDVDA